MKKIKIACKGQKYIPVDKFQNFQGNLKELKKPELDKLKRSIKKYGFSFPVLVWGESLIDGHQRIFAIRELLKEGYTIDPIPIVEIEAKDRKEAGEKLLLFNSHFAKITDEGLYEFLIENEIDFGDLIGDLELLEIDIDGFMDGWLSNSMDENPLEEAEEDDIEETFGVFIECDDEQQQQEVLTRLTKEGLKCRALIS